MVRASYLPVRFFCNWLNFVCQSIYSIGCLWKVGRHTTSPAQTHERSSEEAEESRSDPQHKVQEHSFSLTRMMEWDVVRKPQWPTWDCLEFNHLKMFTNRKQICWTSTDDMKYPGASQWFRNSWTDVFLLLFSHRYLISSSFCKLCLVSKIMFIKIKLQKHLLT